MQNRLHETEFILMPGMDGTGTLFEPLIRVLPQSCAFRIATYPCDRAVTYAGLLDGVVDVVGTGERPVVLVAESFSGPLALRFAAAHPSRVRAVVLSASFVRSPLPAWLRWFAWPVLFRLPIPRALLRLALLNGSANESLVDAAIRARRQVSPVVLADRLRQVCEVDCTQALAECQAPILYLRAEQDRLVGERCVREITRIRPDAVVRSVPGPHLLLQASPVEAWRAISVFLRERGRCRGAGTVFALETVEQDGEVVGGENGA